MYMHVCIFIFIYSDKYGVNTLHIDSLSIYFLLYLNLFLYIDMPYVLRYVCVRI